MAVMKRASRTSVAVVEERIRSVLAGLAPLLPVGDLDLALVSFEQETGVASLVVEGDCPDCDMTAAALLQGIEVHLRARVPEVREVRAVPRTTVND